MTTDSDPSGRLGHPKFTCAHCAREFTRYPSSAKNYPPKYCGAECKYSAFNANGWPVAKATIEVACLVCGKREEVNPARAKTRRFCSQACMLVWRGPVLRKLRYLPAAHEKIKCDSCGVEFETHKCRIKDGRGRFCSRGCVGAWTIRNKQNRVSGAEIRFFGDLKSAGLEFTTQGHMGRWTVDAVFEPEKLAVEFDGEYWHSLPKSAERDARKDAGLRGMGYAVLRIPERLHINDPSAAVKMVRDGLLKLREGLPL